MKSKPSYEQLEQQVIALKQELAANAANSIRLSGINIAWDPEQGTCTFEGLPVAMMWVDTTLAGLMAGAQATVGTKRFLLALQSEGRKSVETDWQVISTFPDFKEGFRAIANIAAVAGWGDWKLVSLDRKKKQCRFRVKNSWEGVYQKNLGVCWGSGMLAGKMAGYSSKLFGTNCWADQTAFICKGDEFDEFVVAPSRRNIEKEIENLLATDAATRADMAVAVEKLNQEITVRRKTEEKLAESEKMLDSIINSVPDIIYRLDPEGRITFISQTVTDYGYTPGELIGQSIYDIVHPDDRAKVRTRIDERRTGNRRTRDLEVRLVSKSLEITAPKGNSAYSVFLLEAEGLYEAGGDQVNRFVGTQGIVREITERKQLESQLQQAQKMEAIGTLAGGIAHDFNNILGSIIGYAEMIEMFDAPEDDTIRDRLKHILASAYRAKDLVKQILTFSRRTDREKVPVVLTPIIKETLKFLRSSLPATVKINARYDAVHSSVLGDATQMYQVMMNLCTNAAHAMGEKGGMLEVKLSTVSFESIDSGQRAELKPGPYIILSVQDSGCGMSPDVAARIFDPFYTTKRQGEGTGLGLAVVHGIVKGMEGAISVNSQIGEGTLFRVYLPLYGEKADHSESEKSTRMVRGKGRILFIDDEKPLVDFVREILTELGYEVVAHTSSPEALEQFSQQPDTFDLVIADVIMPDLTGLELAEAIVKLRPGVPVILCSGFVDPEKAKRAKEMGIKDFIRKPFGVREFAETIRRVLSE